MMDSNAIFSVNNISKSYKFYHDRSVSLKEKILFRDRNRYKLHRVINGISFSVSKGEVVGLIGANGSGKSTLLKMLTKIVYPDVGTISVSGRVAALIELAAGFHPDMTGRENIYINAAIYGLSRKEINNRIHSIIGFSELGQYIDKPVRTYSSGMYMRLAFSIAINVEADILFIDEILAVGDLSFQKKCLNRLNEIKDKGTTIIIVSQSTSTLEEFCNRIIWINDGKIVEDGNPKLVSKLYYDFMEKRVNGNILLDKALSEGDESSTNSVSNKEFIRMTETDVKLCEYSKSLSIRNEINFFTGNATSNIIIPYENGTYYNKSILDNMFIIGNVEKKATYIEIKKDGCLYGPYLLLAKGEYALKIRASVIEEDKNIIQVTANQGLSVICSFPLRNGSNVYHFVLKEDTSNIEFVFRNASEFSLKVFYLLLI